MTGHTGILSPRKKQRVVIRFSFRNPKVLHQTEGKRDSGREEHLVAMP